MPLLSIQRLPALFGSWPLSHIALKSASFNMSVTLLPPSFPYKDPCIILNLIRTALTQIIQDNPDDKILSLITPAKSFWPCQVT